MFLADNLAYLALVSCSKMRGRRPVYISALAMKEVCGVRFQLSRDDIMIHRNMVSLSWIFAHSMIVSCCLLLQRKKVDGFISLCLQLK